MCFLSYLIKSLSIIHDNKKTDFLHRIGPSFITELCMGSDMTDPRLCLRGAPIPSPCCPRAELALMSSVLGAAAQSLGSEYEVTEH